MNKVIIFDVDGTLCDTKKGIINTLNFVLTELGRSTIEEEDELKYIGPSVRESFIKYIGLSEEDAEMATLLYRKNYVEKYIEDTIIYEGVESTLQELHNIGYKLGIATMKTGAQVDVLLSRFLDVKYFEIIKTAREDGSLSKGQMLKEIREVYGNDVKYYMVGDTYGDYRASIEANMEFVFAAYGYGDISKKGNKVHRIDDFRTIMDVLMVCK